MYLSLPFFPCKFEIPLDEKSCLKAKRTFNYAMAPLRTIEIKMIIYRTSSKIGANEGKPLLHPSIMASAACVPKIK